MADKMTSIPVRKGTTLKKRRSLDLPENKARKPRNNIKSHNNETEEGNQEMSKAMVEMKEDDDKENVMPAMLEVIEDSKTKLTHESNEGKEANSSNKVHTEKHQDNNSRIKQYQHVNKVKTNENTATKQEGNETATKHNGNEKSTKQVGNGNHSAGISQTKLKTRHLSHEEQGARPKTAQHGIFESKVPGKESEHRGNRVHPLVEGQKKSGSKLPFLPNEVPQNKGTKFGYLSSKKDLLAKNSRLNSLLQTQEALIRQMQETLDSNQDDIARLQQETEETRERYADTLVRLNIDPETMKPIEQSEEDRLQLQEIREKAKKRVESLLERLGEMQSKSLAGLAFLKDAAKGNVKKIPHCVMCEYDSTSKAKSPQNENIQKATSVPVVKNIVAKYPKAGNEETVVDSEPDAVEEPVENKAAFHGSGDIRNETAEEILKEKLEAITLTQKSTEIKTEHSDANEEVIGPEHTDRDEVNWPVHENVDNKKANVENMESIQKDLVQN